MNAGSDGRNGPALLEELRTPVKEYGLKDRVHITPCRCILGCTYGRRGLLGMRSEGLSQTVFRGQFQPPSFTLALALKDVALATQLGRENNVPMRMANLAEQILRQGVNRGWAEDDYTKAFLLQEEAAGVEVRS